MAGGRDPDAPRTPFVVAGGLVTFGILLGVWIALAGAADGQDLVAGAAASAVAVGAGYLLSRRGKALPRLTTGDLPTLGRLPLRLVVESAQVFALAARKACGRRVAPGTWVEVPVVVDGSGWRAARRDSVVTLLMSMTPNDIVADLDADTGVALVHRLIGGKPDRSSP